MKRKTGVDILLLKTEINGQKKSSTNIRDFDICS